MEPTGGLSLIISVSMCGRVEKPGPDQLQRWLEDTFSEHGWKVPRKPFLGETGEGFPTHTLATLRSADDAAELLGMRWGVRPAWSKRDLINTRQETMTEKSTWSKAFRERRCALPVAGFYEWKDVGAAKKIRNWVGAPNRSLIVLAGLWSEHPEYGPCSSIVTTRAGDVVREIHDRQPVILPVDQLPRWLDPGIQDRGPLEDLLEPYAALVAEPVEQSLL